MDDAYSVEIPGPVFDRLGPQHETGVTAPGAAAAAAGVSILVALIALSGVWRTVRGKWIDDQLADVWERFTWLVDKPRNEFFQTAERSTILLGLAEKADRLDDKDLRAVINHFQLLNLDDIKSKQEKDQESSYADRTAAVLARLEESLAVPEEIRSRAAQARANFEDPQTRETFDKQSAAVAAAAVPGQAGTGAGVGAPTPRMSAYPISAPAQPNRPPTSADVVAQLCDEFTRRLQDAITLGVKAAGLRGDSLDGVTVDAIDAVAASYPRATAESITSALAEFQRQLDGTHVKEYEAVRRAAKAGEIPSTTTTLELKTSATPPAVSAPPRTVEIVLPEYEAAREWVLRNRQYPSPSAIYVDAVLNTS